MLRFGSSFLLKMVGLLSIFILLVFSGCDLLDMFNKQAEGTVKWEWDADSSVSGIGYTPAIGPDGNIYVVAGSPIKLYAISPTGSKLWESQSMEYYPFSITEWSMCYPVISSDGTIYVMAGYYIYAFNSDGSLKWSWTTPESGDPYPHARICNATIGADGTIFFTHCDAGAYHRYLFALNPDGTVKWTRDLADPYIGNVIKNLTVGKDGMLYGQTEGGANYSLYAFNPDDGSIIWTLELNYDVSTNGFAIGSDGTIYIASYENGGRLFAVSSNGTILWHYDGLTSVSTPVVDVDGTIYLVSANGYVDGDLYAFNKDGTVKWHKGNTAGTNLAIAADGTIYGFLSFNDSTNFAAVGSDGVPNWTINVSGNNGSPAIGSDGTIYITHGGDSPGVTAIEGSSSISSSAWPRARGGNGNRGSLN